MNYLLLSLCLLLFTSTPPKKDAQYCAPPIATCYGDTPCKACTSCNYCKHCNSGGTCGICAKPKKEKEKSESKPAPEQPSSSGQCQATTKKGTRCSRSARSGGYCFQHGG